MNTLWLTVGLPRSGKTTTARGAGLPMVNPDSIRLALHGQRFLAEAEPMVWTIARYMVKALFLAGHTDVILDATNTTRERRDEWADKAWIRRFIIVDTPEAVCIERAQAEEDGYIIPIIQRMAARIQPITPEEFRPWELEHLIPGMVEDEG